MDLSHLHIYSISILSVDKIILLSTTAIFILYIGKWINIIIIIWRVKILIHIYYLNYYLKIFRKFTSDQPSYINEFDWLVGFYFYTSPRFKIFLGKILWKYQSITQILLTQNLHTKVKNTNKLLTVKTFFQC